MMKTHRIPTICLTALLAAVALALLVAERTAEASSEEGPPAPRSEYKGRRIAQTMSFHGAPWLIRPERDREENTKLLIEALQVKEGQTIADIGCGNGFYSLPLAELVGPNGRVLAVDIQPEMLAMLDERASEAGIENIEPILGAPADPKLPAGAVDVVLLVDVYHEFSYPERMLAAMRASLKSTGRIALAEYRMEDPSVPIKLLHKMSKNQILKEYRANGFTLVHEFDELPWQHLMFFGRADRAREQREGYVERIEARLGTIQADRHSSTAQ